MPWSYKGFTISQPGVIAPIDNSGVANAASVASREVVLVGSSGGGVPKTVTRINGVADAISKLVSGPLLTAVVRTLISNPGDVRVVRIDPAVQSTYNLVNGATTLLQLQTVDYGDYTKQTNTQVKAGTVKGLSASIIQGGKSFNKDNIYAGAINIQYLGASASGVVTVSNSAGNIQGLSGAASAEIVQWTASFATYATVQDLVNYINAQLGWSATIVSAPAAGATANYFDDATAQACKASAYTVTATLNALKTFFVNSGIVTAVRPSGVGLLPTAMGAPAYFTGGSNGTSTNTDWANAFAALQNEGLARIIVPVTGDASIHAMGDAHCGAMSLPTVNKNRVQIVGGVAGENVSQVVARASALNSRRTSLMYPGIQDLDILTGQLTTYDPYIVAAQAAGMLAASPVVQALTRQLLTCKGLEGTLQSSLQSTDYDTLADSGVNAIRFQQNQNGGTSFYFVRSVTTWQQDTKIVNQEISMVCNEDSVTLRVADAINAYLVGNPGSPTGVGQVISTIDSELRRCVEDGEIVGDENTLAYSDITVTLGSGTVTGGYRATIPAPMNFFGITSSFQIYSKSA